MVEQENQNELKFTEERCNEQDDYAEYEMEEVLLTLVNQDDKTIVLKETFKSGQDFEFVKYKIAKTFDLNVNDIELYHEEKKLIPLFSICDVELNKEKLIYFKVLS